MKRWVVAGERKGERAQRVDGGVSGSGARGEAGGEVSGEGG